MAQSFLVAIGRVKRQIYMPIPKSHSLCHVSWLSSFVHDAQERQTFQDKVVASGTIHGTIPTFE
jgi:hypothetical protein